MLCFRQVIVGLTFCLAVSGLETGCTIIGFGLGAAIDAAEPKTKRLSVRRAGRIRRDMPVTLHMLDGDSLPGRFIELGDVNSIAYRDGFLKFTEGDFAGNDPPRPGDSVAIRLVTGRVIDARLLGYDYLYSTARLPDDSLEDVCDWMCCVYAAADTLSASRAFLQDIAVIRGSANRAISGDGLRQLCTNHQLPLLSRIVLADSLGEYGYDVSRVREIEAPSVRNARWWGLGIGLTVDVALIIIAAATFDMNMDLSTNGGSY